MKRNYRSAGLILLGCALLSLSTSCKKDGPKGIELPKIIDEGTKPEAKVVDLKLDKEALELSAKQGQTAQDAIHVSQGNGEYTATSSSDQVVATFDGSTLTVVATAGAEDYTATVTVKDKAGKTAELSVKVSTIKEEPAPAEKPAEPTPGTPAKPEPANPAPEKPAQPAPQPEKPKPTPTPAQPEKPAAVDLTLGETSVTLAALEGKTASSTVKITKGNGGYKASSSSSHVTATVGANDVVTITATAEAKTYTATVTVTDKEGKKATITVHVNTTPKPVEPKPAPVEPKPAPEKPAEPAAVELTVDKQTLYLEGAAGSEVEGEVHIITGNGNYKVRPAVPGSINHLAPAGSGQRGNAVLFRMKVEATQYTDNFVLYDAKGKGVAIAVTVVPKGSATPKPGAGNKPTNKYPGPYSADQIEGWHGNSAMQYTLDGVTPPFGAKTSVVAVVGDKQKIGYRVGQNYFTLQFAGSLKEGTYAGAAFSYKNGARTYKDETVTVVITKVENGRFWGYYFGGNHKGHFCDKVK